MATRSTSRERYSFANLDEPLELPDLIAIQRESFRWFLEEGLANTFRDISPIKDFSESLQLELEFDPEGFTPNAPQVWGAQPHKGNIFFSDYNSGLWVVKLSDPPSGSR